MVVECVDYEFHLSGRRLKTIEIECNNWLLELKNENIVDFIVGLIISGFWHQLLKIASKLALPHFIAEIK